MGYEDDQDDIVSMGQEIDKLGRELADVFSRHDRRSVALGNAIDQRDIAIEQRNEARDEVERLKAEKANLRVIAQANHDKYFVQYERANRVERELDEALKGRGDD